MTYRHKYSSSNRGDTIIEVMFSVAVAGLIIVLTMAVMNRGVATTQMAVEHTIVRQNMDSQVETLKYMQRELSDPWNDIGLSTESEMPVYGECPDSVPAKAFYLDPMGGGNFIRDNIAGSRPMTEQEREEAEAAAQAAGEEFVEGSIDVSESIKATADAIATPGDGIWIIAVSPSGADYIDFHIRACWEPPFSGPTATLGTIVRLNK